jgi:arginyl-tRNA synthetase
MGVHFDKDYYESQTYKLGKEIIDEGLAKGVFYKRPDGAVAIDLAPDGLDEKILLRSDGTSLYMTQDLGTAQVRYDEYHMDRMIYVVANEQDYHFKVLKLCLQKLGKKWSDGIHHLSYSLVESPTGRFKSREGKTADADDLIADVLQIAEEKTKELGKTDGFSDEEAKKLYKTIGMGALKYFILRVNPYKKIIFNTEESIDFHGHTGPFIQYSHARIKSIIRKYADAVSAIDTDTALHNTERELILQLYEYPNVLISAADKYDPAELANYIYNLAKLYNKFYNEVPILTAPSKEEKQLRILISKVAGDTIKKGMKLLGIEVPDKM